jgi:hypothetical protein
MPESVPAELRAFILRYIDSVGTLEALLIMRGTPSQRWTAETLAPRLYTTREEAMGFLGRLSEDGFLVEEEAGFRFHCATPELERSLDALAAFYAQHLIPVTNLIHSKPRRIREFADAFKLKKDR